MLQKTSITKKSFRKLIGRSKSLLLVAMIRCQLQISVSFIKRTACQRNTLKYDGNLGSMAINAGLLCTRALGRDFRGKMTKLFKPWGRVRDFRPSSTPDSNRRGGRGCAADQSARNSRV